MKKMLCLLLYMLIIASCTLVASAESSKKIEFADQDIQPETEKSIQLDLEEALPEINGSFDYWEYVQENGFAHPSFVFNEKTQIIEGVYEQLPVEVFYVDFPENPQAIVYKNGNEVYDGFMESGMTVEVYIDDRFYKEFTVGELVPIPVRTAEEEFFIKNGYANVSSFKTNSTQVQTTNSSQSYNFGFAYMFRNRNPFNHISTDYGIPGGWVIGWHMGIDFSWGGINNTPIYAVKSGTVVLAGPHGNYGNCVIIDHGNNIRTLYAHLIGMPLVSVGQWIPQDTHIGNVGSTGNSSAPHLHFEVRDQTQIGTQNNPKATNKFYIDPKLCFPEGGSGTPGGNTPTLSDGTFIHYSGNIYRIAGGAPIWVSNWNNVGGSQPYINVSATEFNSLNQYPTDGTYINDMYGSAWVFAGGAPIKIYNWTNLGFAPNVYPDRTVVDYNAINNLDHMRQNPVDGTYIGTVSNYAYRFVGGAPIRVYSWHTLGFSPGVYPNQVIVDPNAITNLDHMRSYPTDGSYINDIYGNAWVFAGGAPIKIYNWTNLGFAPNVYPDRTVVDYNAINNLDHMRSYPADGTYINDMYGSAWVFAGGAPIKIYNWTNLGFAPNVYPDRTVVDYNAINNLDHMRQNPVDNTYVYTIQNTMFRFFGGVPQQVYSWNGQSATLVDMYARYTADTFTTAYTWSLAASQTNTVGLKLINASKKDYVKFVAPVTGNYQIYSSNCTGDVYGELYNSAQTMIAYNDDGGGNLNFRITYTLTAGQTYYILTKNYSSSATTTGTYRLNILVP